MGNGMNKAIYDKDTISDLKITRLTNCASSC
jgi:hypothetical protein